MTIDTTVDIHPRRIRTLEEVDSTLAKINNYERKKKCEAGVVIIQNRQLGGNYEVVSKEEAIKGIKNPRTCEWYVDFYPRSYFEDLRKKLNGGRQRDLKKY